MFATADTITAAYKEQGAVPQQHLLLNSVWAAMLIAGSNFY